jgi:hypothetical protein
LQKLSFELKEFYELLVEEGRLLEWPDSTTYEVALQSLIKILSCFFYKPWCISSGGHKSTRSEIERSTNYFKANFMRITKANNLLYLLKLTNNEKRILESVKNDEWKRIILVINTYNFTVRETFEDSLDTNNEITPEYLSYFSELILSEYEKDFTKKVKVSKRKTKGVFFSPWSIIRKLTDKLLPMEIDYINKTIIDPSCGTGSFLVYAAEKMYQTKVKFNDTGTYSGLKIIRECIYGVDQSPINVLVTKLRLIFWLISKNLYLPEDLTIGTFWNIQQGNSLLGFINEEFHPTLDYLNFLQKIENEFVVASGTQNLENINRQENWLEVAYQLKFAILGKSSNVEKLPRLVDLIQKMHSVLDNAYIQYLQKKRKNKQKLPLFRGIDSAKRSFFHWGLFFPEIFIRNGFDICLGNPPYGRSILSTNEKDLLRNSYRSCQGENVKKISLNAASVFLERSYDLLKPNGKLAFILPFSLLRVEEYETIRNFLLKNTVINEIHDESAAFQEVTLEMCSIILTKDRLIDYTIIISPREGLKAKKVISKSIFQKYARFMIYYDPLWERVNENGLTSIIMADYGIDHRVVKKDLKREYNSSNSYSIPFLHSGKCVNKYALQPKYFHWSKPDQANLRYNQYLEEKKLVCTAIGNQFRVAYKPRNIVPGTNVSIMEIKNKNFDIFPILIILNSSLASYLLRRYVLNYSNLTVYLHKYYTQLIPIRYPSEFEREWKILGKYISFINQYSLLNSTKSYEKEKNLLERITEYLVFHLYFPEVFKDPDFYVESTLRNLLIPIPFEQLISLLLSPPNKEEETEVEKSKKIIETLHTIQKFLEKVSQSKIPRFVELALDILDNHPQLKVIKEIQA